MYYAIREWHAWNLICLNLPPAYLGAFHAFLWPRTQTASRPVQRAFFANTPNGQCSSLSLQLSQVHNGQCSALSLQFPQPHQCQCNALSFCHHTGPIISPLLSNHPIRGAIRLGLIWWLQTRFCYLLEMAQKNSGAPPPKFPSPPKWPPTNWPLRIDSFIYQCIALNVRIPNMYFIFQLTRDAKKLCTLTPCAVLPK